MSEREPAPPLKVLGVILAGGRGRRFGGLNKAMLTLAGRPLLAHVIDRLRPQVEALLLNGDPENACYRPFGLRICADRPGAAPATGPLAGLAAVFASVAGEGTPVPLLLSVPVDTPFLPIDLAPHLASSLAASKADVAFAASNGRDHPIVALWTRQARQRTAALLSEDPHLSLHAVMERLQGVRVDFPGEPIDPFLNINGPEDLAAAQRTLTQGL